VIGFFISTFESAWMFIGVVGMVQLFLALIMPAKRKWSAVLLIPALYLMLAVCCMIASGIPPSDDSFAEFMSGLLLVAGLVFSLPFALIGYFLQKLKVPAAPQESTNA